MRTIKADQRKAPPERDAAALSIVLLGPHKAPLVPPAIHAAQHERAGRAGMGPGPRGRLYRRPARAEQPAATAILHGFAPQDGASDAAAPQWEPRKPLGGTRKPRRETETPAGPK